MPYSHLEIQEQAGVAYLWMNRPELHNAFNPQLIHELTEAVKTFNQQSHIRAIVLAGRGKSFSAGADLSWMQAAANYSYQENLKDSQLLAEMLATLYYSPKPLIARIHGPTLGGGVGLVSVCDIAIASEDAYFAMSEVKIGLIPATIGPYVLQAIGPRQAHRYFLTGERMAAQTAQQIGLVHRICNSIELDQNIAQCLEQLLANSPAAIGAAKKLIQDFTYRQIQPDLIEDSAQRIARIRVSSEGQVGLQAFLNKTTPPWALPPKKPS